MTERNLCYFSWWWVIIAPHYFKPWWRVLCNAGSPMRWRLCLCCWSTSPWRRWERSLAGRTGEETAFSHRVCLFFFFLRETDPAVCVIMCQFAFWWYKGNQFQGQLAWNCFLLFSSTTPSSPSHFWWQMMKFDDCYWQWERLNLLKLFSK